MSITKSISPKEPVTDPDKTAIVLAWHNVRESVGETSDKLIALIRHRLGLNNIYLWPGLGRDRNTYPEIPRHTERALILPVFMSCGLMLRTTLPGLIKFVQQKTASKVVCLPPVGLHHKLADMIARRGILTARMNDIVPEDAHLVIVAHGSEKHPESALSTRELIKHISAKNLFAGVYESYLEQPPCPGSIVAGLSGPVIAEALFLTPGRHFTKDFPAAIARGHRPVLFTPQGGLSCDPMFNDIVCDILKHALNEPRASK